HVERIGVFPSGMFLAYGWDEVEHRPTLALLKEDGSILEFLSPPKGSTPASAFDKGGNEKGPAVFVQPSQFVQYGHSIIILWMRTDMPLIEVNETGALRVIRPNLPPDEHIEMLIPSDDN